MKNQKKASATRSSVAIPLIYVINFIRTMLKCGPPQRTRKKASATILSIVILLIYVVPFVRTMLKTISR